MSHKFINTQHLLQKTIIGLIEVLEHMEDESCDNIIASKKDILKNYDLMQWYIDTITDIRLSLHEDGNKTSTDASTDASESIEKPV